ncbi:type III secretion system chaperone [Pseudomonas chlororaphis]|uniref:type III secretion system chaperone n=1 Tax=Pseudomonas chlororaphis TaxID=587753 RepID=UPI00068D8615|nr:type III secretion system chaperone [Pseudomonas chlororaphis]
MSITHSVLRQLSSQSGLPGLAFDDSGLCQLRVDDLKLALYDNHALNCLTLLCELPTLPAHAPDPSTHARLALTYQFKALHEDMPIIGLNSPSNTLVAMQHLPLTQLSIERLSQAIGALIDWSNNWESELAALESASDAPRPHSYV